MLTVIDEYSRKCLTIRVGSALKADDVLYTLSDLFVKRAFPIISAQIMVVSLQPKPCGNGSRALA